MAGDPRPGGVARAPLRPGRGRHLGVGRVGRCRPGSCSPRSGCRRSAARCCGRGLCVRCVMAFLVRELTAERGPRSRSLRQFRGLERMLVHVLADRSSLPFAAAATTRRTCGTSPGPGSRPDCSPSTGVPPWAGARSPARRLRVADANAVPAAAGRPARLVGPLLLRAAHAPRAGRHGRADPGGGRGRRAGGRPGSRGVSRRYDGPRAHWQPVPRRGVDVRPARLRGRRPAQARPAGDAQAFGGGRGLSSST